MTPEETQAAINDGIDKAMSKFFTLFAEMIRHASEGANDKPCSVEIVDGKALDKITVKAYGATVAQAGLEAELEAQRLRSNRP